MRTIIVLLFIYCSAAVYAKKEFDGYYIKGKDTVACKIVARLMLDKTINPLSVTKYVLVLENGVVNKYKPHQIDAFVIKSSADVESKFVSLATDKRNFYQEIIKGRISYYQVCSMNAYDGSPALLPVVVKNNKDVFLNVINPRKRLAKLIIDYPQLHSDWVNTDKYSNSDRHKVIELYNKHFEEK